MLSKKRNQIDRKWKKTWKLIKLIFGMINNAKNGWFTTDKNKWKKTLPSLGQSDTCCWKNWTLIGVLISLYAFGILTMHIHFLLRKETVAEFSVFFICLAVNFLFIYLDYGVLMASCFLWVKDLKSKLKHLLAQSKATVEEFEKILLDFSKLRYSMEVLASFVFPLSQVLAVASAYLGFTAGRTIF